MLSLDGFYIRIRKNIDEFFREVKEGCRSLPVGIIRFRKGAGRLGFSSSRLAKRIQLFRRLCRIIASNSGVSSIRSVELECLSYSSEKNNDGDSFRGLSVEFIFEVEGSVDNRRVLEEITMVFASLFAESESDDRIFDCVDSSTPNVDAFPRTRTGGAFLASLEKSVQR